MIEESVDVVLSAPEYEHGFWIEEPGGARRHPRQDYDVARVPDSGDVVFGYESASGVRWVTWVSAPPGTDVVPKQTRYERLTTASGERYSFWRCAGCGSETAGSPSEVLHDDDCPDAAKWRGD